MKHDLEQSVAAAVKELFNVDVAVELTRPDEQFGDFATNIALQLAKDVGKNPREIAEVIAVKIRENLADKVSNVSVAGPGFLNFTLTEATLVAQLTNNQGMSEQNKQILVEFGDPNPFKEMHLGHLYTAVVGDAIARLLEQEGADVKRLSYHGDVGLHVAKAMWAMLRDEKVRSLLELSDEEIERSSRNPSTEDFHDQVILGISQSLGSFYKEGAAAYENDETAKQEIQEINEHIYKQDDPTITRLHKLGTEWSFGYFDLTFEELGIEYTPNGRYLESQSEKIGIEYVRQNLGKVFEESEGAIVYKGEKVGLHTRVFINSRGLPTYEAKDLGLAELKNQDYPNANRSIIITAHEQSEYFKVMLAALHEIDADLADKTTHLAHGFLSLTTGKMSSRTGNVYNANSLIWNVEEEVKRQFPDTKPENNTYLAAIKYTMLKNRLGGDIVFDVQESVSLEGNSGPYLQYAHARARSILAKTPAVIPTEAEESRGDQAGFFGFAQDDKLEADERSLLRKITEFTEVVDKAVAELMPHHICTYLYELAQQFNSFYEQNRVIGDDREQIRVQLVTHYADTLKTGLRLLGITAPDRL